jgi:predicted nuclease of restriction endonuclease-like (RecB) superfamily
MKIYFNKKISKQQFNKGTSKFTIIEYLSDNGKYTIKNNKLTQYVLENLNSKDKELIDGFFASTEIWKINEDVYTIPFNHVRITREITKYKMNDNFYFVEEVINNNMSSNYILTNYKLGDTRIIKILNSL